MCVFSYAQTVVALAARTCSGIFVIRDPPAVINRPLMTVISAAGSR